MPESSNSNQSVIVVGAGVAGLAAASALAQAGYQVQLLERRPYVGGRASSYLHPALGEVVDCQHVLLGCCTNLLLLYEQAGVLDKIRWYEEQTFLERNGQATRMSLSSLPAPLHFLPSFLRAPMLGVRDKLAIARGLLPLVRGIPEDSGESAEQWLRRSGQTELAMRHFWRPVLIATLNDTPERCSVRYAGQVFRELFLKTSTGGRLGIPTIPLSELYDYVATDITSHGGNIELRANVEAITRGTDGRWAINTANGSYTAGAVVLALPSERIGALLSSLPRSEAFKTHHAALNANIARFEHSPYTTVHLWYDRQVTELDHAWLLDSGIDWLFHKSRIRGYAPEHGSYLEVVIAASRPHLKMERDAILASVQEELAVFFPETRRARVLKSGILKEAYATFSALPGLEASRPSAETPWPGISLAGDWTATSWPSTMEGAVRSGYLAAEAVSRAAGQQLRLVQPDLPATGLMRLVR